MQKIILFFIVFLLSSCASNPAEYIAGIFDANASKVNTNQDQSDEDIKINEEELEVNKSFLDSLTFWETDDVYIKNSNLNLKKMWSVDIGSSRDAASAFLHPSISENSAVYTIDTDGLITSIDINTGDVNWRYNTKLDVTSGILFYNNQLFFGTSDGKLYGFDIELLKNEYSLMSSIDFTNMISGGSVAPTIELQLDSEIVSPGIGKNNILYFKQGDGNVVAMSILENRVEWVHQGKNVALSLKGSAAIAQDSSNVYVARDDGNFVSLTSDTGKLNWLATISPRSGRNDLEALRDVEMIPVIKDGLIYVGSYQGSLISVDIISGETIWSRQISIHSNVDIDDDYIYVASQNGDLYALDRFNGDIKWHSIVDDKTLFVSPVLVDQYIVSFSIRGYILILDKNNGNLIHYNKMLDDIDKESSMLKIDKTLYIVTKNGRLNAVKIN